MPAVRTRSRRVKGPGDLENETTQAKETNNCTHAADTSSMKSASDSGVDLCQDDETRLAAAEREPLKRKQQQQPKDCGETESKKRRVNRKSTQQQPSVSEVPNEGEAGSSRLSDEVAVADEPPARADHKTESATETRDRKKAQPESQERRESSSKARGTRETTPDVVVVKWPKKRRGESCARRFIRAPRAQASSPIEIPDDEDVAGQASSIASGRRRREPRAARDVIVLESPEGRRRKPSAKPGKSRSRTKATSPIEIPDDEKVADQPSSLASGRPRRSTRAAKVSTVEKTKIPKGDSDEESDLESETDFSDNDDEDFVLPKSDHSDDDIPAEASEEDIVPEAVSEDEDERRPGLKKPITVGRRKKIKRFLDDIEQPRSIKNTIIVSPSSESAEVEINIPVKKPIKPISQRTPKAGRSSRGKSRSVLDDDEEVVTEKKPSTSKARAVITKKRFLSSSEDSDAAPKKTKAVKKVKTVSSEAGKKTFMKPRRAPKPKTKESRSSLGSSRFEMSLLKLAKQMDDSDDSEDGSQDSSQAASEVKTEEIPVEDVKQEPENDADKKRLIMSMLKEHEEVDEMSDDDSDEDAVAGKTPAPKVKSEVDPGNAASCSGTRPKNIEDGPIKKSEESSVNTEAKGSKTGTKKSKKAAEKATQKKGKSKKRGKAEVVKEEEESSGSDDENWEVVEDRDPNYQRPENVTVVLQNEDFLPETKRLSMEQRMIRLINRKRKTSYLLCHRVHLMSLVGHHRILNSIADDDYVKAYALSRLPHPIVLPGKRQKASEIIRQLLLFYKSSFELNSSDDVFDPKLLKANLIKLLAKKVTSCNIVYLFGLLVLLRASGIRTRLCLSYHLLPLKAPLLRVKDGEIVELGSKTKAAETEHGIVDFFIEVYLSDKKKWRPVDIEEFAVMTDPHELTPHLDQPVACLIGIDNNGCMVDLSPKYNADWLDKMKHLRSDAKFFNEILARYAPAESEQAEEQQEVEELHEQQGLPKIISQFKNHPKYALARHLLKFEAFYPREPPILGYVRNEPVHPRECVHTLRSKDTWHRSARQVKEGELPYSIVKARPKWNKQTESMIKDLPLEVYGEWQTEPFQPPVAENGIIPRNKFGNVELFHPDMLPIGTVHLKLPGLQRIATELEVDCVPAVIGFDGVGRGCHPVLEGFVVCVENQELLEEAWNERQREDRHKRRERIRKRAVKNWKKLIRKVVWDLRLKRKYKNKLEEE